MANESLAMLWQKCCRLVNKHAKDWVFGEESISRHREWRKEYWEKFFYLSVDRREPWHLSIFVPKKKGDQTNTFKHIICRGMMEEEMFISTSSEIALKSPYYFWVTMILHSMMIVIPAEQTAEAEGPASEILSEVELFAELCKYYDDIDEQRLKSDADTKRVNPNDQARICAMRASLKNLKQFLQRRKHIKHLFPQLGTQVKTTQNALSQMMPRRKKQLPKRGKRVLPHAGKEAKNPDKQHSKVDRRVHRQAAVDREESEQGHISFPSARWCLPRARPSNIGVRNNGRAQKYKKTTLPGLG